MTGPASLTMNGAGWPTASKADAIWCVVRDGADAAGAEPSDRDAARVLERRDDALQRARNVGVAVLVDEVVDADVLRLVLTRVAVERAVREDDEVRLAPRVASVLTIEGAVHRRVRVIPEEVRDRVGAHAAEHPGEHRARDAVVADAIALEPNDELAALLGEVDADTGRRAVAALVALDRQPLPLLVVLVVDRDRVRIGRLGRGLPVVRRRRLRRRSRRRVVSRHRRTVDLRIIGRSRSRLIA